MIAMQDAGFILASYAVTFGVLAVLAARAIRTSRRIARDVDDTDKNWT